jgi:hypothetical protein
MDHKLSDLINELDFLGNILLHSLAVRLKDGLQSAGPKASNRPQAQ